MGVEAAVQENLKGYNDGGCVRLVLGCVEEDVVALWWGMWSSWGGGRWCDVEDNVVEEDYGGGCSGGCVRDDWK